MMFLIFIGFIACAGNTVGSSCPIEVSPPRAVVHYKDSFSANCTALSDQTEGMGWESSNGGRALENGVFLIPLKIDSVTDWSLEPNCYINFFNGSQCSADLPVTVYKLPDGVSMSQPSRMGPMIEGQEYVMQCDIVNVAPVSKLSVHWHKGNKIFYTDTFDESTPSPVSKSSVISVTAHRDDDGTQIWCGAELNLGPAGPELTLKRSESHDVTVLYPPVFTKPGDEVLEVPAGSEVTLDCTATGNPMPVYSWHLPHTIQPMNKNLNLSQPILTPSFQLPGTYKCTVSNEWGNKTKCFTIVETKRDRTTFAALVGGFVFVGVAFFILGLFFVTPQGTFSCSKGSYLRGRPTSSGPV